MGANDAQRLIALSLGKIAMSRQQRGGINLHKNLLVASVLHKARTTYMMDNFQVLLASKKAQAEREAAAKMIIDTPTQQQPQPQQLQQQQIPKQQQQSVTGSVESRRAESMDVPHGVSDCARVNSVREAPKGERPVSERVSVNHDRVADKENEMPSADNVNCVDSDDKDSCEWANKKSQAIDSRACPIVTGKVPLSVNKGNVGLSGQLMSACRCAGSKRRRSFVASESTCTVPKKARFDDEEYSDSDYDSDCERDESEVMHTESSQVTNLVDIFNSGFNGLYRGDNQDIQEDSSSSSPNTRQINVYVSSDRPIHHHHHQYVLSDVSCGTQMKDAVSMPTAIALAV